MSQVWVRNLDADDLFETFLVSAISSVLGIRLFLAATGYPRIGGDTLHIAHMLWGGLLMLAALVLLFAFLGRAVRTLAAILGGVGFGAFIDELGKFITADNDYFYRPAVALIYVTFVILYLVFHALRPRRLTEQERIANALETLHEAVRHDLDERERRRALELLEDAEPDDPVTASLRQAIERLPAPRTGEPGWLARARASVRAGYLLLVTWPWFGRAIVAIAAALAVSTVIGIVNVVPQLAEVVVLAALAVVLMAALIRAVQQRRHQRSLIFTLALAGTIVLALLRIVTQPSLPALSFFAWAELVSAAVPAAWFLIGIQRLRRSRLDALRTFEQAILFEILVTEVFAFYERQLEAVLGLLADLLTLTVIRTMIQQELALRREVPQGGG